MELTKFQEQVIGLIAIAIFLGAFLWWFIKSCIKTTDTPEELDPINEEANDLIQESPFVEDERYIFKLPSGITIKENDTPRLFTYEQAINFADQFPYYKIMKYGELEWHSARTYFTGFSQPKQP